MNLKPRGSGLQALRALFAFLVQMGALEESPAQEVRLPKKDAATRLLVTDDDLIRLLEATERQASDFRCVRDRAVLSVLIFCGLRRQELLALTVPVVNLDDESLLVQQGKGQKSRTIYLCPDALAALREWVGLRRGKRARHDCLFVDEGGRRFGGGSLSRMLEGPFVLFGTQLFAATLQGPAPVAVGARV